MKRYRVRFHLARGDNYMKWQVFDKQQNTKDYFDPNSKSLFMKNCELGNHPTTAKILQRGQQDGVCMDILRRLSGLGQRQIHTKCRRYDPLQVQSQKESTLVYRHPRQQGRPEARHHDNTEQSSVWISIYDSSGTLASRQLKPPHLKESGDGLWSVN